jgi:hypothetical protein
LEIISNQKTENVEDWSFVMKGGITATYVVRIDRNEKATLVQNSIDGTPVEIRLTFRDDVSNDIVGGISFPVVNLLSYAIHKRVAPVYAPGESPIEQELKRAELAKDARLQKRAEQLAAAEALD